MKINQSSKKTKGKAALLAALLCLSTLLSACVVTDNLKDKEPQDEQSLGSVSVSLRDSEVSENEQGQAILTLLLDFKNTGSADVMYMSAVKDGAVQNGESLAEVPYLEGGAQNTDYIVSPEESITVKRAFVLNDTTGEVVFTASETSSDGTQKFEYTIDL